MPDHLDTFRSAVHRFRTGGIAIGALPLGLGVALLLAGERVPALEMLVVSVILILLVLWTANCVEEAVAKMQGGGQKRD